MKSSAFTLHADELDEVSGGMHWQRPVVPAELLVPPNIGGDGRLQWSPQAEQYFQDIERYERGMPRSEPTTPPLEPPQDRQPRDEAPRAADDDVWDNGGDTRSADPTGNQEDPSFENTDTDVASFEGGDGFAYEGGDDFAYEGGDNFGFE